MAKFPLEGARGLWERRKQCGSFFKKIFISLFLTKVLLTYNVSYLFQVCNIMIRHFMHSEIITTISLVITIISYQVITVLSIMFFILCTIPLWLVYIITESLHLFIPFTHLAYSPATTSLSCSVSLFYAFLDSLYKQNHVVFVLLWFISLSIILSRPVHLCCP